MSTKRISEAKRLEMRTLYWAGMGTLRIAELVGCHHSSITLLIRKVPWPPRKRSKLRLSLLEREEISRGLAAGHSMRAIARRLNRAASTISREVATKTRSEYRAWMGEERADRLAARPKPSKLESAPHLKLYVETGLENLWSPTQIATRLKTDYPDDSSMRISPETIYQSLFIQGRGTLRKELTKHLRQGRTGRRPRGPRGEPGKMRGMVNISKRPAEVADRAVPGHWEGDLIIGKNQLSAIGTLVERTTRFVMLLYLPNGRTAEHVRMALTQKILTLPAELRRSLTWDQGRELAEHAKFTVETGVKVYFCDPHSPWQRGSNENTNGLLRQYFPKGTDLSVHDQAELDRVARQLNGRPRQTLNWRTPHEKLNELLKAA